MDFYQGQRRLAALERIEIKQKEQLEAALVETEEEEITQLSAKKGRPLGSKKTKPPKDPRPQDPIKVKPKEPQPIAPKSSRQVIKTCLCGAVFSVQKSWAPRKHTCGKPGCSSLKRSLSLRKNESWFKPKTCQGISCCNFLDPDRRRSRQTHFCSIQCKQNAKNIISG